MSCYESRERSIVFAVDMTRAVVGALTVCFSVLFLVLFFAKKLSPSFYSTYFRLFTAFLITVSFRVRLERTRVLRRSSTSCSACRSRCSATGRCATCC